jgi:CheY-like chemotaxis protein
MVEVMELHGNSKLADAIKQHPCRKCGAMMPLRVVEPDRPGLELRTFECPTCYETESLVASIGEAASVRSGSELPLILVIEDEYPLQGIVEEVLAKGGFGADILSSAEEALTLFKSGTKEYKALVTDVSLKGRLSGWEVASQVRERDPAFPIVYMTGVAADQWALRGVPNSILLEKPFAPARIVTAISRLLNRGPTTV